MPVGPVKKAYQERVKAAIAARAAKTASPVVEAAKQSIKQIRRRRFRQKVDRPLGAQPQQRTGGLGFGGQDRFALQGGRYTSGGKAKQKLTLEAGKGFQQEFDPKSGWSGAQLGGRRTGFGGRRTFGSGKSGGGLGELADLSVHKGYAEPPSSKQWRIGVPRPEIRNPFTNPTSPLRRAKKVYQFGF